MIAGGYYMLFFWCLSIMKVQFSCDYLQSFCFFIKFYMAYFVFPAAFRLLNSFAAFAVSEIFDRCVLVFPIIWSFALMCFMFLMFFNHIISLMFLLLWCFSFLCLLLFWFPDYLIFYVVDVYDVFCNSWFFIFMVCIQFSARAGFAGRTSCLFRSSGHCLYSPLQNRKLML